MKIVLIPGLLTDTVIGYVENLSCLLLIFKKNNKIVTVTVYKKLGSALLCAHVL